MRARIFKYHYDSVTSSFVGTLNKDSNLATEMWFETVEWRDYEYKIKPTLATHAREVARQAATARPPEEDDLDYEPHDCGTARNLVLVTKRGTLVDFLDHFETKIQTHIQHRNLVSTEHRSKLQYTRNSRPLTIARDIDFAENGSIENFDKIQSEHWVTNQYTLFMSIVSFLMVDEWNKEVGILNNNAEVTVNGERYIGEQRAETCINSKSYWEKIIRRDENDTYIVENADAEQRKVSRSQLRHRSRHIICCGHVSDDKRHDRFAMQHFTDEEFKYIEAYISETFPNDLNNNVIQQLHQHSDNASQHFKSTGAIEYFTSLIMKRGGATKCMYVYSFGAPGHGKGVFDGIGGAIKNKVHSLIKASKTSSGGVPGVDSGYIGTVDEVFQAIRYHFEDGDNRVRTRSGSNPINHYKFFSHLVADNPIRRPATTSLLFIIVDLSTNGNDHVGVWSVCQRCTLHCIGAKHTLFLGVCLVGKIQQRCTTSQEKVVQRNVGLG